MKSESDELMNELLNDYMLEAAEHIQNIQHGLIQLENCTDENARVQFIESVFRETHSLKGASRVLNQSETEKICMSLESHFGVLKKHPITLSTEYFNAYNNATAMLDNLLNGLKNNQQKPNFSAIASILQTLEFSLNSLQKTVSTQKSDEVKTVKQDENKSIVSESNYESIPLSNLQHSETETVRVDVSKLNNILLQTEEFVTSKNTMKHVMIELNKLQNQFSAMRNNMLTNNQLNIANEKIKKADDDLRSILYQFKNFQNQLERQIDDMQLDVRNILLLPLRTLFATAPKLIRDLSSGSSKKVKFILTGEHIEMDRRIIEAMKDPVIHILRNCIDHGIEMPEQRLIKQKNEQAIIKVEIIQLENKKIQIEISDDGAGINTQKIIQKALKSKLISPEQIEQTDLSTFNSLIFKSGISTSDIITDISGRGLGMAIVEEKVLKNNGTIELFSTPDKGTTFRITFPQTLTVYKGILVNMAAGYFSIPLSNVVRAIRLFKQDIKTVEGRNCIFWNEKAISVIDLSDVLGIAKSNRKAIASEMEHALLIESNNQHAVLIVDKVSGQFESVLKSMGSQLKHVENITGVTVMGNGNLVPVLNIAELLRNAGNKIQTTSNFEHENNPNTTKNRILVAEDSITIRTMLRSFLENAGFDVKTAVDGLQAYELLQQNVFDLVVSDVEMPRMNGFELTAKIRETTAYSQLPVILVTALETPDDKQRGLEAGANAYIVKRSFDQSNLVDTIKRLL